MKPATTCPSGKNPFPAPWWANKIARHYNQNHRRRLRTYRCPECDQYHLTSRTRCHAPQGVPS